MPTPTRLSITTMPKQPFKKSSGASRSTTTTQNPHKRPRNESDTKGKSIQRSPREKIDLLRSKKQNKPSVSFAQSQAQSTTREAKAQKKTVRVLDGPEVSPKGKGKLPRSGSESTSKSSSQPSTSTPSSSLPTGFTIVVGSYEKLLYGIEGTFSLSTQHQKSNEPNNSTSSSSPAPHMHVPTLKPVFIFPAHVASVKCVAASPDGGRWLATGSSDEVIKVWDLRRRKEVGGLMQHQGACLCSPPSHICYSPENTLNDGRMTNDERYRLDNTPLFPFPNTSYLRLRRRHNSTLSRS